MKPFKPRKRICEELLSLSCFSNTVKVIVSRRMRLLEDVAHIEEMRSVYRILVRKPMGRNCLGNLGLEGRKAVPGMCSNLYHSL